jgi:hypothetical protein
MGWGTDQIVVFFGVSLVCLVIVTVTLISDGSIGPAIVFGAAALGTGGAFVWRMGRR